MKPVYFLSLGLVLFWVSAACGVYEETTEAKFAPSKIENKKPVPYDGTNFKDGIHSTYYAKYRFSLDGCYDVDVALRVGFNNNGIPIKMEVKDLLISPSESFMLPPGLIVYIDPELQLDAGTIL